jgi:hypothetical protein
MDIIIEKINVMGLVQTTRTIKLPKGRLLITIGDKRFTVMNQGDTPRVDKLEVNLEKIQTNFADNSKPNA